MKQAVKYTADQMENELDNYTFETLFIVKVGEQTLYQQMTMAKIDRGQMAMEEKTVTQQADGQIYARYFYRDQTMSISSNNTDKTYYVYEFGH
ncbi:hypothetical protein HUR95_06640 [Caldalkalibacillus thermarum TA2.A1]|uniref:Uncharacterized protein n=1 Tax=Caldalkalibacillus thermarum (strain TA2.A1) TaxID=986075 RepID=A0A8X8IC12_CALTT|nr:hypothetical protein [Caldalkalibacillus thermarum]QZT34919.1 hypothetical protein HUR95_06640 [Caldalkalibacillus thermarum TA2.A1]